jgi:hypothetical protein
MYATTRSTTRPARDSEARAAARRALQDAYNWRDDAAGQDAQQVRADPGAGAPGSQD